jgi:hypothetical protein
MGEPEAEPGSVGPSGRRRPVLFFMTATDKQQVPNQQCAERLDNPRFGGGR